jgi:hypothetical protein
MSVDCDFTILSARSEPHAAAPTVVLRLQLSTSPAVVVHTAIIRCQILLDPRRRRYSESEGERLNELFGEPSRWNETMGRLLWTNVPIVAPRFHRECELDLPIVCTYDFAVASAKFFSALDDGLVPLTCQFSGTMFLAAANGFEVAPIGWDKEASFRLPIATWNEAMDSHFAGTAWIRLAHDSFDALARFKARRALPTWEAAVDALCAEADERDRYELR